MKSLVNPEIDRTPLPAGASCPTKSHFPSLLGPAFGLAAVICSLMTRDAVAASFSNAAPLLINRSGQTATLLSNGQLLVAGGQTSGGFTSFTAEIHDPAIASCSRATSMS